MGSCCKYTNGDLMGILWCTRRYVTDGNVGIAAWPRRGRRCRCRCFWRRCCGLVTAMAQIASLPETFQQFICLNPHTGATIFPIGSITYPIVFALITVIIVITLIIIASRLTRSQIVSMPVQVNIQCTSVNHNGVSIPRISRWDMANFNFVSTTIATATCIAAIKQESL